MKTIDHRFTRGIVVAGHISPLSNFKHEFDIQEDDTTLGRLLITLSPFLATVEIADTAYHIRETAGKYILVADNSPGSILVSTQMKGFFFWTARFVDDLLDAQFSFRPWPQPNTKPGLTINNELCGTVQLSQCFPLTLDLHFNPSIALPVIAYTAALYLAAWDNYSP